MLAGGRCSWCCAITAEQLPPPGAAGSTPAAPERVSAAAAGFSSSETPLGARFLCQTAALRSSSPASGWLQQPCVTHLSFRVARLDRRQGLSAPVLLAAGHAAAASTRLASCCSLLLGWHQQVASADAQKAQQSTAQCWVCCGVVACSVTGLPAGLCFLPAGRLMRAGPAGSIPCVGVCRAHCRVHHPLVQQWRQLQQPLLLLRQRRCGVHAGWWRAIGAGG